MLRVGVTGGVGSGKSTVARQLASHGAFVIDADALAREVLAAGSPGLAAVVAEFGPGVLGVDGALDRAALAAAAFSAPGRRQALEAITHPAIAARTRDLLAGAPNDAVVVHDVPLLVEKAMSPGYHLVLVVDAPVEVRVRRLADRGMSPADARARMDAQASTEQRRAAADVWLDNGNDVDRVDEAVRSLWVDRLVPFEANVRARVAAPRPEPGRLVGPDPRWPEHGARALARIAAVGRGRILSAAHVGPTALAAQPAEDVLDLKVVVADEATARALGDDLVEVGLVVLPEPVPGRPAGPGEQVVVLARSADPGRAVDVRIEAEGLAGARAGSAIRF